MNTKSQNSQESILPGKGERIAMGGYNPQYVTAVGLTLRHLRYQRLQEVRLADLDAGRVDDLVLVLSAQVIHAYQMKAGEGELSYSDFVKGDRLIHQLADGWKRLATLFPEHKIFVHLCTDQKLSISTHGNIYLPLGNPQPVEPYFKSFWEKVWNPFQKNPSFNIPIGWQRAFSEWKQVTELSEEDFVEFAKSMSIVPLIAEAEVCKIGSIEDLTKLYYHFQCKVSEAKTSNASLIIPSEDLEKLLEVQFNLLNLQEFPVSPSYCPIEETIIALNEAINTFSSGYIAIIGTPGSGKSSLLTQTLVQSSRNERIIRYYCFLPNESFGLTPRTEATNFLNDLVVQLERYGFDASERIPKVELNTLRRRFNEQLKKLESSYQENQQKTLIIIDGLDHILEDTSGQISNTLFSVLPEPEQLPEGVLIVLGSQHLTKIPYSIEAQLQTENTRLIKIKSLSQDDIITIVNKRKLVEPLSIEGENIVAEAFSHRISLIYRLSEGHPLALDYILNQLEQTIDEKQDIDRRLNNIFPYEGNIKKQYYRHWQQIDENTRVNLQEFVGLIARIRGTLNFKWIRSWNQTMHFASQEFEKRFGHFLRPVRNNQWVFFHESFRLFLLEQSIKTIDDSNADEDKRLYEQLADFCNNSSTPAIHQWNQVYYLWKAENFKRVCTTATSHLFTQQLHSFRPIEDIIYDTHLVVKAAASLHNPVEILRALLLLSEYEQRNFNIDYKKDQTFELLELLVDLKSSDKAIAWVLIGEHLRVERFSLEENIRIRCLKLCVKLRDKGYLPEAVKLFNQAEPLHVLRCRDPISNRNATNLKEVLYAWVNAVIYFRPLSYILDRIYSLRWESPNYEKRSSEDLTCDNQNSLLFSIGNNLINLKKWNELDVVVSKFSLSIFRSRKYRYSLIWKACHYLKSTNGEENNTKYINQMRAEFPIKQLIEETDRLKTNISVLQLEADEKNKSSNRLQWSGYVELDECKEKIQELFKMRTKYAEAVYKFENDELTAKELLNGIPWFSFSESYQTDNFFNNLIDLLRQCTLKTALSQDRPSLTEIVPSSGYKEGVVMLVRAACRIAILQGERWRKNILFDPFSFRQDIHAITNFHHVDSEERGWIGWRITINESLPELCYRIIREGEFRGEEALEIVFGELKAVFESSAKSKYWPDNARREVLLHWLKYEKYYEWANIELVKLLNKNIYAEEASEQVNEALTRAKIWLEIDNSQKAQEWIQKSLDFSLGVGQDGDYLWLEWMLLKNKVDPKGIQERVDLCARRIIALRQTTSRGNSFQTSLLLDAFQWVPIQSIDLFWWFFQRNILDYAESMQLLVNFYLQKAKTDYELSLSPAFSIFCNLIIPTYCYDSDNLPLIEQVLESAACRSKEELYRRTLEIWKIANTECPQTISNKIGYKLSSFIKKCGYNGEDIGLTFPKLDMPITKPSRTHEKRLKLSSMEELDYAEVCGQVKADFNKLLLFKKQEVIPEKSYERFRWNDLIKDIAANLPDSNAISIAADCIDLEYSSLVFSALGERAFELGNIALALKLGEQALWQSNNRGWAYFIDGGSRKKAFELLTKLVPDKFVNEAYIYFGEDVEHSDGTKLAQGFAGFIPIFQAELYISQLCDLVEVYIQKMFAHIEVSSEKVAFEYNVPEIKNNHTNGLILLVLTHLKHPASLIVARSLRVLAELFLELPDLVCPIINYALKQDWLLKERVLMVCEAVSLKNPALLFSLVPTLKELLNLTHFSILQIVKRILKTLNEEIATTVMTPLAKVPAFNIIIPEMDIDYEQETLGMQLFLEEVVGTLFDMELIFIAEKANLNKRFLLKKVMELLVKDYSLDELVGEEKKIANRVADLRLNFFRPLVGAARRAINHLIIDLFQTELLSANAINYLEMFLQPHDPIMLMWHPEQKPKDVSPMEGKTKSNLLDICTPEELFDCFPIWHDKEYFILGEYIETSSGKDGYKTYYSISTFLLKDLVFTEKSINDLTMVFSIFPSCTIANYPRISPFGDNNGEYVSLCVRPDNTWFETLGSHWIALRPDVARACGWYIEPQDTFRWMSQNKLMSNSFWWKSGTVESIAAKSCEGWRTVLTKEALNKVLGKYNGQLWRVVEAQLFNENREPTQRKRWGFLLKEFLF